MDEFINSLHNTIDYNKEEITEILKNSGNTFLKLTFEVYPLTPVRFRIECEKVASKEFYELKPFTIEEVLNNETK